MKIKKKIAGLLLGCMILTGSIAFVPAASAAGLVPDCGVLSKTGEVDTDNKPIMRDDSGKVVTTGGTQKQITIMAAPCDFNYLMDLINKIIDFLLFYLATPLVVIILCYAGFNLITSGASSESITKTKHIIKNVIFGYIIALVAWLVVHAILKAVGFTGPTYLIQ